MEATYEANGSHVPVRIPVELEPLLHRRLIQWCRDTALQLDVSGVARADVLECLIELLDDDPRVAHAVLRRLAAGRAAGVGA